MTLDELIARLEELRTLYGGELPVIYDGVRSPVNKATYLEPRWHREASIALSES